VALGGVSGAPNLSRGGFGRLESGRDPFLRNQHDAEKSDHSAVHPTGQAIDSLSQLKTAGGSRHTPDLLGYPS
jgi:hypothetical protein